ncbi:HEPN domain-containing protein [Vibrio owensii]|uniref:HEPN domain-containing protein n=1 Tax=Vibrio owensii TaxID=696485 RepID=UPI003398AB14
MTNATGQDSLALSIMGGDSHMRIANSFLQTMPYEIEEIAKNGLENSGNLFACATNLALSIELYLKALLIKHEIRPAKVHDLKELYETLPNSEKKRVESAYKSYKPYPLNPFDKSSSFTFLASKSGPRVKKKDMASILSRSKDNFVEFRYIFDSIDKSNTNSIMFEYGALWCIARALRLQLGDPTINYENRKVVLCSPFKS